ncbi:MAG TPA: plastocyanin/azurin family copper-binding protein [Longimicrobiales bacterium]|nr:plastocyanin/azurin family copper-binding protein [Longimicrobiales bacterium]
MGFRFVRWIAVAAAVAALAQAVFVTESRSEVATLAAATGTVTPTTELPADTARVVEITSTGVDLAFEPAEIRARPGEEIRIRYVNESDMAHNIIIVRTEADIEPVGLAAIRAHANGYVPEDEMDRIIAYTKVIGPGEVAETTFTVPEPGTYPFICTYSGHFTMMQGRLISAE